MSLLRRSADRGGRGEADEDPFVRQYRFLLRTAPGDALDAVHREALEALTCDDRRAVLRTVQEQLVAGLRLDADDVRAVARLVVLGERRSPGAVLRHTDPPVLRRLADAALASEAAFGLLTGYAAWDGADPELAEAEWEVTDHHEKWHDARLNPGATWSHSVGGGAGGLGGGAGDGGGGL